VRFLLDECLPPSIAGLLRAVGHDCAHVYELGLGGQPDVQVMALADRQNRILISADTDFGELLANAPVLAPITSCCLPCRSVVVLVRADQPDLRAAARAWARPLDTPYPAGRGSRPDASMCLYSSIGRSWAGTLSAPKHASRDSRLCPN
jgi:predicted nuclease of predicted toxin-antitoxin system